MDGIQQGPDTNDRQHLINDDGVSAFSVSPTLFHRPSAQIDDPFSDPPASYDYHPPSDANFHEMTYLTGDIPGSDQAPPMQHVSRGDSVSRSSRLGGLGILRSLHRVPVGAKSPPPERSSYPSGGQNSSDYASDLQKPETALHTSTDNGSAQRTPMSDHFLVPTRDGTPNNRSESRAVTADSTPSSFHDQFTPRSGYNDEAGSEDDFDEQAFKTKFARVPDHCSSKYDIYSKRTGWLPITIFVLSVYSTVMSGIWLVMSFVQPRWGHRISSKSNFSPSTASLITALVAKTIELSFVTVFITCMGQILSRRSLVRQTKGVTLAEMTMRNWVLQPGSLITHFETVRYGALTFLGVLSLTATMAAMFYTTASDAMVAPKLKLGSWEQQELSGYIRASYANAQYVKQVCPSLLNVDQDYASGESCMNIRFSGQSYRNLLSFMSTWEAVKDNGTDYFSGFKRRPTGSTLLYDNTTVTPSWIETSHSNIESQFEKGGRIINNVTLALPHPGVYEAATNPINEILQPNDLAGVGEYAIRAGVVSPSINALCVNMNADELKPLVYTEWPDAKTETTVVQDQVIGWSGWEGDVPVYDDYLNKTPVDDIFRWGSQYKRRPPVFRLYPADYNIVTNITVYQGDAIYLLAKSPAMANYTLCQLQSWVSPNCSTHFNISGTMGASMSSHCEDPKDRDNYIRSYPLKAPPQWSGPSLDWKWLGVEWALSMDIGGGSSNNNASNARLLTQLALKSPKLPRSLPTMAEALAIYASSTVMISAIDSPFVHWWDYDDDNNIIDPQIAKFNGSVITQQYTSGHTAEWQNIFYIVLILIFVINLLCMLYLAFRTGLVTDFTEPQNLFALAVNSPPSTQLNGSCGAGPKQRDLVVPWKVAYAPSANHYFFEEANETPWKGKYKSHGVSTASEPVEGDRDRQGGSSYKRLSTRSDWHL